MGLQFNSFGAFAAHCVASILTMEAKEHIVLHEIGNLVEEKVKHIIGQENVQGLNGFESHEPLAESTIQFKEDHGFTGRESATDPNLRTGELYHSITHVVDVEHHAVVIGSNLDQAVYVEIGTSRQPPRSILGIGGEQSREEIEKLGIEIAISLIKR
jgi:hypothetical protein